MRYQLQKLIREVNRSPEFRSQYLADPEPLMARYALADDEKAALRDRDYGKLYAMGVHGLLLRPFSLLFSVPENAYLEQIRRRANA